MDQVSNTSVLFPSCCHHGLLFIIFHCMSGIGIGYSSMGTAIDISLMIHPDSTIVPSQSVIDGRSNEMHAVALAVLVASIASKEVLFRKTLECGQATNSSVIF